MVFTLLVLTLLVFPLLVFPLLYNTITSVRLREVARTLLTTFRVSLVVLRHVAPLRLVTNKVVNYLSRGTSWKKNVEAAPIDDAELIFDVPGKRLKLVSQSIRRLQSVRLFGAAH